MFHGWLLLAGSSPSLPDGSNPSAAIVQSASDVQCSRLLKTTAGAVTAFEIDPLRREGLLHGLDDIGLTLKDDAQVRAWQDDDRKRRPWAWPAGAAAGATA